MKLLNSSRRLNGERSLARRPTTFKRGHFGIESVFTTPNLRPPFSPVNDALRPGNAMTEEISVKRGLLE